MLCLIRTSVPPTWVQATCLTPADVRGLMALEHRAVALALCRSWQRVQMLAVTEVACYGFLPVGEATLGKPALLLWGATPKPQLGQNDQTRTGLSARRKHAETLPHPSRGCLFRQVFLVN